MNEEIVPGACLIFGMGEVAARGLKCLHVLVGQCEPAEVSQVPIEDIVLRLDFGGDRRHDEVTAIAAVAGDGKGPCAVIFAGGLHDSRIGSRRA